MGARGPFGESIAWLAALRTYSLAEAIAHQARSKLCLIEGEADGGGRG